MTDDERRELYRLRDEANSGEFAIRRAERALAEEELELERRLEQERLEQEATAKALAAEYRREHYNQDPPPRKP
jgi:hypothetical protein